MAPPTGFTELAYWFQAQTSPFYEKKYFCCKERNNDNALNEYEDNNYSHILMLSTWCKFQLELFAKKYHVSGKRQHVYYFYVKRMNTSCTKAPSMSFYPDFISILSWFYPDFILILSRFFRNSLYPNFIQILSWFYPNFIQIKSK